jgi:hypothetical protein
MGAKEILHVASDREKDVPMIGPSPSFDDVLDDVPR